MAANFSKLCAATWLCLVAFPVSAGNDTAAEARTIDLWPDGPPGVQTQPTEQTVVERGDAQAVRDRYSIGITEPSLTIFEADEPNGTGILIVPGGGYRRVVMDKEGYEAARWFADRGMTSFVLLHRLPAESWSDGPDVPLQDAERAMRWIRAAAPTFALDQECIGAVGFSAGGHVVATLATRYDDEVYAPVDAIDRQPTRPDFTVLLYPVISMQADVAHAGSRTRLLGEHPSAADVEHYSAHMNVTAAMPPTFLLHAADDDAVPLQNTLLMYEALRNAGIESELHVFAEGGHGFGLRYTSELPVAAWPELVAAWVGRVCGGGG